MSEHEQDFSMQFLNSLMENEKREKVERFRRLNQYVKKGQIVFAGSSLMEQFPIYEFLMDFDLPYIIYNRGIGGYTTKEMQKCMDVCIYELEPQAVFINIGTNDLNAFGYSLNELVDQYEQIIREIKVHLPETKIYMMAYYPVNAELANSSHLEEIFRSRTNEKIQRANGLLEKMAQENHITFLNLNDVITDENGNLKKEITVEGMHMYADGYRLILDKLLPVLQNLKIEKE